LYLTNWHSEISQHYSCYKALILQFTLLVDDHVRIFQKTLNNFFCFCATLYLLNAFIWAMTAETEKRRIKRQTNMAHSADDNLGLIQRACSDPDAFARLYLQHYDAVFHYCVRRLFDRHCAEDVTSTVFFKVMHNLSSFNGTMITFKHWLFRIATNAVNDYLRDVKKRRDLNQRIGNNALVESAFTISPDPDLPEKKALLQQAILRLKPRYQAVITLHYFENMKLIEIAACLDKKPSTVRNWLFRATKILRRELGAAMNDGGSA
jgi:RNA polymerase sigma factor (sigma-70 family)